MLQSNRQVYVFAFHPESLKLVLSVHRYFPSSPKKAVRSDIITYPCPEKTTEQNIIITEFNTIQLFICPYEIGPYSTYSVNLQICPQV